MSTTSRRILPAAILGIACCGASIGAGAQEPGSSDRPGMDQGNNVSTGDKSGMSASRPMSMGPVTAQTFATQAATIGKAEIELGQLAMKNGKDDSVKEYAQRMVKDHTVADAKLKTIAARENLTLPSDLDAEHKAVKQKLSSLKGDEFDAAYRAEMAKGHQKAIALFQSASQTNALPDDLRQFAASTLPTLKQHHEMAESLETDEASDSMTR